MSALVLGEIAYANVLPLFDAWRAAHGLDPDGAPPGVRVVRGDPATLNAALRRGEVDVAPCSSIEYARDPDGYRLLPGLSIAAEGAVESVLLFTRAPLDALRPGSRVALSPASATSSLLVRLLLAERGVPADFVTAPSAALTPGADAALVIGDEALAASRDRAGFRHVYDLGLLWREATGLPFVFALFIVRADAAASHADLVGRLAADLVAAKAATPGRRRALAEREAGRAGLSPARLVTYWETIRYDLGPRERAGLEAYYGLAVRHGLLPAVPPLRFVTTPLS